MFYSVMMLLSAIVDEREFPIKEGGPNPRWSPYPYLAYWDLLPALRGVGKADLNDRFVHILSCPLRTATMTSPGTSHYSLGFPHRAQRHQAYSILSETSQLVSPIMACEAEFRREPIFGSYTEGARGGAAEGQPVPSMLKHFRLLFSTHSPRDLQ